MSLTIDRVISGKLMQNGYVVANDAGDAIVIDPGGEADAFVGLIEDRGLTPHAIVNTHGHYDHVGGVVPLMRRFGLPFYLDTADSRVLRSANIYRFVFDGEVSIEIPAITHDLAAEEDPLTIAGFSITCVPTPGHTPGSRSLLIEDQLFTGDTLFKDGIGRTDLHGGDAEALTESLGRLLELPSETTIHPGHEDSSTLGRERRLNPWLRNIA